ncbi:MAG: hemerythrin family protein [Gammaproteobacteria bacterium]|nr:hemerythrin family protein [Gammaproteobacteria bacterium]MCP5416008.1 hemerythrin family protein [Chromatiaceae bacterium]
MKDLVWDKLLSVQVGEIDDDHRRLVDLFNMLCHAVADEEERLYIEAVLDELISCTVWHFRHEERLMLKYGYSDFWEHRNEHQELIESAKALQQAFVQQGKSLTDEEIEFLEHWLTGHILTSDMQLGVFLCMKM